MLLITAASIALLALLNYRYTKSPFHPAVIFCTFWAFALFVLWAAGYLFYRIHSTSLITFLCGAAVFSLGSFLASLRKTSQPPRIFAFKTNRLITAAAWITALSLPIYIRWILSLVETRGATQTFLMAARISLIDIQGTGMVSTLFGATLLSSIVIAMVAFRERQGHGKRALVSVVAATIICVLTATKGAPLWLGVGLLFLHWLKTRRLKLQAIAIALLVFSSVIFSVEFFVHINAGSLKESTAPVLENVALYVSGGIIGFDQVVENHTIIAPVANPPYDTLKRIAKRFFGTHVEVAPAIPPYLFVGPHDFRANTYTMYSSWLVFGLAGSVLMMLPIGYFTTRIYQRALVGGACSSILYGLFVSGLAFSPLEDFLTSLAMIAFFAGIPWCLFYLPVRFNQFIGTLYKPFGTDLGCQNENSASLAVLNDNRASTFLHAFRHWRSSLHLKVQDGLRGSDDQSRI
jgi:oligosaccharide repeat unit polymerase